MKLFLSSLVVLSALVPSYGQVNTFVLGTGTFTTSSLVHVKNSKANGGIQREFNDPSSGFSTGLDVWRRSNGLEFSTGYSKTDARLTNPSGNHTLMTWPIDRYQFSAMALHRFQMPRMAPFAGLGVSSAILYGGRLTGFSGVINVAGTAGTDVRISRNLALRLGLAASTGTASVYGDRYCTGTRNVTLEPQAGLVWSLKRGTTK